MAFTSAVHMEVEEGEREREEDRKTLGPSFSPFFLVSCRPAIERSIKRKEDPRPIPSPLLGIYRQAGGASPSHSLFLLLSSHEVEVQPRLGASPLPLPHPTPSNTPPPPKGKHGRRRRRRLPKSPSFSPRTDRPPPPPLLQQQRRRPPPPGPNSPSLPCRIRKPSSLGTLASVLPAGRRRRKGT